MLAGRIKLKTFLALTVPPLLLGGFVLVIAMGWGGISAMGKLADASADREAAEREAFRERIEAEHASRPTTPAAPAAAAVDTGRPWDGVVLGWQGKDLGAKKKKDATSGKPYKVNLYQDEGHSSVNRAKVDIDRDDRWDEKWTFKDGEISRKVAPLDDEDYTRVYVWSGDSWTEQ